MKDLILNVHAKYFKQIKNGTKEKICNTMVEFREYKLYWFNKLLNKTYSGIQIRLGYPKSNDKDKILNFKWNGFVSIDIIHEVFKSKKQKVFAIFLSKDKLKFN